MIKEKASGNNCDRRSPRPESAADASSSAAADFIRALPKTELHIHAEAVLGPGTYEALIHRYRRIISSDLPERYAELSRPGPLDDMIRRFLLLQALLRRPEDYALLAGDLRRYAAANSISYMEVFVSPSQALRSGLLDFADIMDPLIENSSPDIAFIVDVSRTFGPENAASNLEATLGYLGKRGQRGIVGIGLGGREAGNPLSGYRDTFRTAREAGLHTVAHAGEETGPESVRDAVLILGAERIGHGTSAIRDPGVMALLRDSGVSLEVCPTSNVYTGAFVRRFEDHPLPAFRDAGLSVTVNSDDPALFGVGLNEELSRVSTRLGFSRADIVRVLATAIDVSFMPEERKAAERAKLA